MVSFFLLLVDVSNTFQISSLRLLEIKQGSKSEKVLETATRSKNMKPLWKFRDFEQHISWNARVPDCGFS